MIDYIKLMLDLAAAGNKQGVLFFISTYALALGLLSFFYQLRIRHWPIVKGHLLNASISKWGAVEPIQHEQDYSAQVVYEYHIASNKYIGSRVSPWFLIATHNARYFLKMQLNNVAYNDDGTVNIIVNPNNPKKSFLIKPSMTGVFFTLLITLLPMALYFYTYHFSF